MVVPKLDLVSGVSMDTGGRLKYDHRRLPTGPWVMSCAMNKEATQQGGGISVRHPHSLCVGMRQLLTHVWRRTT